MSKFDPSKPVQTRDGRKATILKTDFRNTTYPIVAVIHYDKEDHLRTFAADGRFFSHTDETNPEDLVNVPEVTTQYCNMYTLMNPTFHGEKRLANLCQSRVQARIALLKITKTDGVITAVELIQE